MAHSEIVETTGNLAAWRIDDFTNINSGIISEDFKMGKWYWRLEARQFESITITLKPKEVYFSTQRLPAPIASLVVRVFCSKGPPRIFEAESIEQEISFIEGFPISIDFPAHERAPITLGLEFRDLKMALQNDGEFFSIWGEEHSEHTSSDGLLSRMLSENLYTDIVISTEDGCIGAHRAVLAAISPVFNAMFSENYKEKETSTVNISDMSIGACKVMLNFIYGKRCETIEFQAHRMELFSLADKYDIIDLKKTSEASLCRDINSKNVFERLKFASMYRLPELKSTCLFYLVKMGMVFNLRDEYKAFLQESDHELIAEVFKSFIDMGDERELTVEFLSACVSAWKAAEAVVNS